MVTAILILLIILTGILGAYTQNFQKTTLALGKKLAPDNPSLPTGFQDAITPKAQTLRNIVFFILILGILVYGLVFYKWYLAIAFTISAFLLTVILMIVLPRPESDFYIRKIKQDLLKRKSQYKKTGDADREIAIDEVLRRFEGLH